MKLLWALAIAALAFGATACSLTGGRPGSPAGTETFVKGEMAKHGL